MQCNIDAKGRAARLITGILTALVGIALCLAAWLALGPFWILLGAGILALAGGAFQIYEGWAGWCVMRAMGFRTPM